MTHADRVFKENCATRGKPVTVAVAGLEMHLTLQNKNPHADGRWVHFTNPAYRQMQETRLRGGRER